MGARFAGTVEEDGNDQTQCEFESGGAIAE